MVHRNGEDSSTDPNQFDIKYDIEMCCNLQLGEGGGLHYGQWKHPGQWKPLLQSV